MHIYPAIDLKAGACVRLYQGCYDNVTVYPTDPIAMANAFAEQGAKFLHVVDLDGAKQGSPVNTAIITQILQNTPLKIQIGGGIRDEKQVRYFLNQGVDKIILGSIAVLNPILVKEWLQEFGAERIVLALDIRMNEKQEPMIATHGWQSSSELSLWQVLEDYQSTALIHVLCTDIHCDGSLQGPNYNLYNECYSRYPALCFQASGGISSLKDLQILAEIPVAGAIVGKALYENKFSLKEALERVC
jgi:phosphoribosylformimino-5-aminoimidazole carboxamide ribotide isomerase